MATVCNVHQVLLHLQMVEGSLNSPCFRWAGHKALRIQAQEHLPSHLFPRAQGMQAQVHALSPVLATAACLLLAMFPLYVILSSLPPHKQHMWLRPVPVKKAV